MHIVHINEAALFSEPPSASLNGRAQQIQATMTAALAPHSVTVVLIEQVFGPDGTPAERRAQLHALLDSVTDVTQREDLVRTLRIALLRMVAAARGCNKLLLGDSATGIASRFLAAAAKVCAWQMACGSSRPPLHCAVLARLCVAHRMMR